MLKYISIVLLGMSLTGFFNQAVASSVTIPNSFSSGTPAVAAEVNDNFTAVENAVNDNDSRLSAIETGSISVNLMGLIDDDDDDSCRLRRNAGGYAYYNIGSGSTCTAYMPVALPQGRTLLTMSCTVFDNDSNGPSNVDDIGLRRSVLSSGVSQTIFNGPASIESPSLQQLVDNAPTIGRAVIDNNSYTYFIRAAFDEADTIATDIRVYGCVITYQ